MQQTVNNMKWAGEIIQMGRKEERGSFRVEMLKVKNKQTKNKWKLARSTQAGTAWMMAWIDRMNSWWVNWNKNSRTGATLDQMTFQTCTGFHRHCISLTLSQHLSSTEDPSEENHCRMIFQLSIFLKLVWRSERTWHGHDQEFVGSLSVPYLCAYQFEGEKRAIFKRRG